MFNWALSQIQQEQKTRDVETVQNILYNQTYTIYSVQRGYFHFFLTIYDFGNIYWEKQRKTQDFLAVQ